jgi:hypothetical protein
VTETRLIRTQTAPELGQMYVAECDFPSKCHTKQRFCVMASQEPKIRLFLSHAFEDKESFVRALASELSRDFDVWYDEYSLRLGDRLLPSISKGLKECDYGIVVLSQHFFKKKWTQAELEGLFALETEERKIVLPVWHGVERDSVAVFHPLLADRVAVKSSEGLHTVVNAIKNAVGFIQLDRQIQSSFAMKALSISKKIAVSQNAESIQRSEKFPALVLDAVNRLFSALEEHVQRLASNLELHLRRDDRAYSPLRPPTDQIVYHTKFILTGPLDCSLKVALKELLSTHTFELETRITGRLSPSYAFADDDIYLAFPTDKNSAAWKSNQVGSFYSSEDLAERLVDLYLAQMERMA